MYAGREVLQRSSLAIVMVADLLLVCVMSRLALHDTESGLEESQKSRLHEPAEQFCSELMCIELIA